MKVNFKNFGKHFMPAKLDDFAFTNSDDKILLDDLIDDSRPFPGNGRNGILIYGEPGTGKSSLANLLPELIEQARYNRNCSYFTQQNCAAGGQTAGFVNSLATKLNFTALGASYNYIVLDEVDCLTPTAMDALKSVMDIKLTTGLFFLTTNSLKGISGPVRDRCYEIHMGSTVLPWTPVVQKVLAAYNANVYSESQIQSVVAACNGSGRGILNAAQDLVQHYYNAHEDLVPPMLP